MTDELVVAQVISDVSQWGIGRDLGTPVLHDYGSGDEKYDIEFP